MWKSEDDFLKDIAALNDFGSPDDRESCKILYSIGRGLKTKEKPKTAVKFIDARTGEAINLEDPTLDNNYASYKSKGRGSLVGSLFRTTLQLQQQLRLARPLGSGDEAIESYYGKGRSQDNVSNSKSLPDFEFSDENTKLTLENHDGNSKSNKTRKRVIATRNSSSQVNALITNLLSKQKEGSDATMKQEFIKDLKQKNSSFSESEKCIKSGYMDNIQNSSSSDSDFSDSTLCNNWNKKAFENNINYCKEGKSRFMKKKHLGDESFKIIDDDESEEEEEESKKEKVKEKNLEKKETNNDFNENFGKVKNNIELLELSNNDRDMKYKALGERVNRLRKSCWNTMENGSYDSVSFFDNNVRTERVILNDEDFPPLPRN